MSTPEAVRNWPETRPSPFDGTSVDRHGCLWFDGDPGKGPRDPSATGGLASIGGGEPFRFQKVSDLPLDVVWWTNLERAEQWSFGKLKRFKDSAFFGPSLNSLTEEGEIPGENMGPIVQRWSETFARAADWLSRWAAIQTPEKAWEWGEGALADALRPRLLPPDLPERTEVEHALRQAYCEEILCEIPRAAYQDKRSVTLSLPRWYHAQRLLRETVVPVGPWQSIDEWPEASERRLDWIEKATVPLLIQVDHIFFKSNDEPNLAGTSLGAMWVGQRGRRFNAATMEPVWMTQNEVVALRKFADMEVISGYQAEEWASIPWPEGLADSEEGPLLHWAPTKGLLATAAWRALASPGRDPNNRRKGATSPRAVWLRAQDRLYTFAAATIMQTMGYPVLSYGNGQVRIMFDENGSEAHLAKVARQAGLLLPARLARAPSVPTDLQNPGEGFPRTIEDVARLDQWIKKTARDVDATTGAPLINVHLALDRLVLPWPGKNARTVMGEAATRLIKLDDQASSGLQAWWKDVLRQQARQSVDRIKRMH